MQTMTVGGLTVNLQSTSAGPILEVAGAQEPLAWVVNAALAGDIPDMPGHLERGENALAEVAIFAARPNAQHNLAPLLNRWKSLTGRDAGDDVYLVGASFLEDKFLIPRSVLQELLNRLIDLRKNYPLLNGTEPPSAEKEQRMRWLEQRAAEVDALADAARGDEAHKGEIARKRRFLLFDLFATGLLDADRAAEKLHWLQAWGLTRLTGYFDAVLKLHDYYHSETRFKFNPEADIPNILAGPITIDWFRLNVPVPPDSTPERWTGFVEAVLTSLLPLEGENGKLLSHVGEQWYEIYWRKENVLTPAVFYAEVSQVKH
jgi:hypothetical protein